MTTPTATPIPRKLGPGVLTVGTVGDVLDVSKRCKKGAITWKVDQKDDTVVLSGDTIPGDRTYTATLEATLDQDDLTEGGNIDWTWTHKGESHPFTYTPYAGGRSITGIIVVDPLDVGGDVNSKNTSDLKWGCVGEPELTDDLS